MSNKTQLNIDKERSIITFLDGKISIKESGDTKIFQATISEIRNENDMFSLISETMSFPDYFGKNWDALYDCLTDMSWAPSEKYYLVLSESALGWLKQPIVMGNFLSTWLDAASFWKKNNVQFYLVFQDALQ